MKILLVDRSTVRAVLIIFILSLFRFCTCNVLGFGSTFYDLVLQCSGYIRRNMRVTHCLPDLNDLKFAKRVMDLTLPVRLRKLQDMYDSENLQWKVRVSTLQQRTELFLAVFNSNWKRTSEADLVHCCFMGCPCGCKSRAEVADLAANLFTEIILASRPVVPALSRWLKCSKSTKWFLQFV